MSNRRRRIVKWSILSLLIVILLLVGLLCGVIFLVGDRSVPLQIENRTDTALTIYIEGHKAGDVELNKTIKIKDVPSTLSCYMIEAKNSEGVTVYSREFDYGQLVLLDWKVVIW